MFSGPSIAIRFGLQLGVMAWLGVGCSDDLRIKLVSADRSACLEGESECPSIESLRPLSAKGGSQIFLKGTNLSKKLTITIEGVTVASTLEASGELSFILPDGTAGLVSVSIFRGSLELSPKQIFRLGADGIPYHSGEAALVCQGQSFYDDSGAIQTGTRVCQVTLDPSALGASDIAAGLEIAGIKGTGTLASSVKTCSVDGEKDCRVLGPTMAAVALTGLSAKLLSSESVAGISGTVLLPAVGKVLTGTSYGPTSAPWVGTLSLPAANLVLASSGSYGDPGAPMVASFTPDLPAAANVRAGDTVGGVNGALADCVANGAVDCVTSPSFKAADLSQLTAAHIKSGVTIAGQLGGYPSAAHPLSGADGTNDLVAFGPGVATGLYEFFDSAGNRYTGTVADGGTVTPGVSSQTTSAADTFYRQVIVAGDSDLVAGKIKDGVSLFGVGGSLAGAPANCGSDGADSCLVDGTNFVAGAQSGAASKIISGQTLAGVAGNVTLPAVGKVLTATQYGVSGTGLTGTLTLPLANTVLAGSAAYGEAGALLTPSYSPDFPLAANVRASDTVNGGAGSLADCSAGNQAACVTTASFKSMNLTSAGTDTGITAANFNASIRTAANFEFWDAAGTRYSVTGDSDLAAAKILDGETIFGVTGSVTASPANCSANGAQSCVATGSYFAGTACGVDGSNCFVPPYVASSQPLKAISYDAIDAGKAAIRSSLTLSGIQGTLADCSAGNAVGCVTTATYKSMDLSGLGANSSSAVTAANFNTSLRTAGNYEFWDAAGARHQIAGDADLTAANISNAVVIHGVTGTATLETHSPCSGGNQTGCVATATYKTMDLTDATGGMTDLTSGNFNATIATAANFEFWDSNGARYQVAGDADLASANILSSATIFGVSGSATAAPANCSSNGSQSCVATGSYFAGMACATDGSNCFLPPYVASTQPLKAISYDAIDAGKASMRTTLTLSGIQGTLPLCTAGNTVGCMTTATYKSIDLSALGSNSASGLTAANLNTSLATAANFEFWDAAGARHQIAGDADLAAANIANGVGIHGATGTATLEAHSPCGGANQSGCVATATYRTMDLSAATGGMTDLTSGNFNATIATAGNFEFWNSAGARYQVAGDGDLVAANIVGPANIFGVAGSGAANPGNCALNGAQSCVVTGPYYAATACAEDGSNCFIPTYAASTQPLKAISYDSINDQEANFSNALTLSGVTGTLPVCTAGNTIGCVTTATYKSMNVSAAGGATGLTAANFQTRLVTAANSEFWDAAGARHTMTGDADLSVDKIKAGVVVHGVTGQYPSATYRLAANTGTTDFTLFTTQVTSAGSFEFFDSEGARYTGSGDGDLGNGNIKNGVAIESLSLTGSYVTPLSCPAGWIKVPGDSDYGTADFCVMKFEAKSVSTVATSQAALTPWVSISQTSSMTACRALGTGYDLISHPQWMSIGANVAGINSNWTNGTVGDGYLFAGHNDASPNSACAASSDDSYFYVETNCTPITSGDTTEQRRTLSLSNSNVVWDLPGNANEWVNYMNRGDKPGATAAWHEYTALSGTTTTALKDLIPTNAVKAFWSDTWNSSKWIGQLYPGTNNSGGALIGGGNWDDTNNAGVFSWNLNNAPSLTRTDIGFRCSSALSP